MNRPLTVMITAGETSGDGLAAEMIAALRRRYGGAIRLIGCGGDQLAAQGLTSAFDIKELAVFGVVDALMARGRVKRRIAELVALAKAERPDVAVMVDSWGFSAALAKALRQALPNLKRVKYVAPQVWASRPHRAKTAADLFDVMIALNAFEAPYFEAQGLKTVITGLPAAHQPPGQGEAFRRAHGLSVDAPLLLIAPGSRPSEIKRVGPEFVAAAQRLGAKFPDLRFAAPVAPIVEAALKTLLAPLQDHLILVSGEAEKRDLYAAATAGLVCSGTVTTEIAAQGCPFAVGYRIDAISYAVLKPLLRTDFITLINVSENQRIVPEFLQKNLEEDQLAAAIEPWLDSPGARQAASAAVLKGVKGLRYSDAAPADIAAAVVLETCGVTPASGV